MEQHTEEVPAHREPSLHDGTSWVALRPLEAAPVPQPVFLAKIDPFRLAAGLRRYNALRTAAGDVGQVAICVVGSAVEPGLRCPGE
jgi:hypothetical protein